MFKLCKPGEPGSSDFYKAAERLLPVLEWTPPAEPGKAAELRRVVAEEEIYLGNLPAAAVWTLLIVLSICALVWVWSKKKSELITAFKPKPGLLLLTGPDGYLSLWRTQLTIWTVAVGSLVLLFGMLQLNVPEIPETLVTLMGMSLLTGLTAKRGQAASPTPDAVAQAAETVPAVVAAKLSPDWVDLISTWNDATQQVELSIPKAQMVFWTVIVVALFCVKSVLGGALWSVPWAMVALTGFSQAGYIGDKFVKGKA
jgi:hypothetical protein